MTTMTAPTTVAAPSALRTVLLVDGTGTAALGLVALAAAEPLSDHVGTPGALRAVGVLFLVIGVDMLLTRRLEGRRLAAGTAALGVADLAFAAAITAALAFVDTTGTGTALVLAIAAVCVGMGVAKLVLSRRLTG